MTMPPIETNRLLIRPLATDDLAAIHHILDVELADAEFGTEGAQTLDARERWLQWTVLAYEQLAALRQPPYGERAVVFKETGELIGACGYTPCLGQFRRLPSFSSQGEAEETAMGLTMTEFGLYWAISPRYQRRGYATEAAGALIDYAFAELRLRRVIATTTYDNAASIRVMEKAGMRIERNPSQDPPWLQVVGILYHPELQL